MITLYDAARCPFCARVRIVLAEKRVPHDVVDEVLREMPYLTGRAFGLADVAYVPWVIRARHMPGVDVDATPALAARLDGLASRPSVAAEIELAAAVAT